jgi:hypothetical protein
MNERPGGDPRQESGYGGGWSALEVAVAGVIVWCVLFFAWLSGCGQTSSFESFSQGCDGIATFERRGDTEIMECDRGTTDTKPKGRP